MSAGIFQNVEDTPISMDKEGRWFYYGSEIVNETISLLFAQHVERDGNGHYVIKLWGDKAYVKFEDTPYIVFRVYRRDDGDEAPPHFDIYLNDGSCERLDLKSLRLNEESVIYCNVKGGEYTARFHRNSAHQLLKYLEYDEAAEIYYIESDGIRYRIGQ